MVVGEEAFSTQWNVANGRTDIILSQNLCAIHGLTFTQTSEKQFWNAEK